MARIIAVRATGENWRGKTCGRPPRGYVDPSSRSTPSCGSHQARSKVYGDAMSFTLWLSAEEERILAKIMKAEGARSKEQAVIKAIREKGDLLAVADRPLRETPERTTERAPSA